jgi:UDP-2,3-diacylglucosamine pyrophosphatase LpxH
MKKLRSTHIVNLVLIILSAIILIWITNLPGFIGLCRWNPIYSTILITLWVTVFILVLLFIISLIDFKNKKITKIGKVTSLIISSLLTIFLLGMFLYLVIPTFSKVEDRYLINEINGKNLNINGDSKLSFAVSSDPHWGSENSNTQVTNQILRDINNQDYDAFLCLGDISELGSTQSYYKDATTDIKENLGNMPIHVVLGNHDALINGTQYFKKYFQRDLDNFYSRFDYDNIHIITLNLLWDAKQFDKKQETWLIEQLESIPKEDMTIVLSHCFAYSSGYKDINTGKNWFDNEDVINEVTPILEKYNVELMISGHNHLMELLKNNNTHYAVVGTMGGKLDSERDYTSPNSIWLDTENYGYMDLEVYRDYLEITFKDQNSNSLYSTRIENN